MATYDIVSYHTSPFCCIMDMAHLLFFRIEHAFELNEYFERKLYFAINEVHMTNYTTAIGEALAALRRKKPIVHNITNYVTAHECANVLLAIGGSPIMASHPGEVQEITTLSQSLVLNIGTIEEGTATSMLLAGKQANTLQIPIVIDPVGAGATLLRRRVATHLPSQLEVAIIRGNASEIMALYEISYTAGGVDATDESLPITQAATAIAKKYNSVVAVTGAVDIITDGTIVVELHNGVDLLPMLTGTGCMTTAIVGAFASVVSPMTAAIAGITTMSVAGEKAYSKLQHGEWIGSFGRYLHDAIGLMTPEMLVEKARIVVVKE